MSNYDRFLLLNSFSRLRDQTQMGAYVYQSTMKHCKMPKSAFYQQWKTSLMSLPLNWK
ncbi:uncharacterized protein GLRG_09008 [Colletotrichum graminicola M1.001]|uniref:Uncharacterized protein n=1 Tax=Colletotrichum graminicola (strain M1.001 / M2 / FGSC 10212) TaxID=645133 RepID=E3QSM6_COLGM|nr:uncharacterized protein GLRG_09008 [Colletotrichum graminicola M1.001]EFQ33864.1 hypothetical protein GLRG_09008 [Colletotrichum graminicola M1.001]